MTSKAYDRRREQPMVCHVIAASSKEPRSVRLKRLYAISTRALVLCIALFASRANAAIIRSKVALFPEDGIENNGDWDSGKFAITDPLGGQVVLAAGDKLELEVSFVEHDLRIHSTQRGPIESWEQIYFQFDDVGGVPIAAELLGLYRWEFLRTGGELRKNPVTGIHDLQPDGTGTIVTNDLNNLTDTRFRTGGIKLKVSAPGRLAGNWNVTTARLEIDSSDAIGPAVPVTPPVVILGGADLVPRFDFAPPALQAQSVWGNPRVWLRAGIPNAPDAIARMPKFAGLSSLTILADRTIGYLDYDSGTTISTRQPAVLTFDVSEGDAEIQIRTEDLIDLDVNMHLADNLVVNFQKAGELKWGGVVSEDLTDSDPRSVTIFGNGLKGQSADLDAETTGVSGGIVIDNGLLSLNNRFVAPVIARQCAQVDLEFLPDATHSFSIGPRSMISGDSAELAALVVGGNLTLDENAIIGFEAAGSARPKNIDETKLIYGVDGSFGENITIGSAAGPGNFRGIAGSKAGVFDVLENTFSGNIEVQGSADIFALPGGILQLTGTITGAAGDSVVRFKKGEVRINNIRNDQLLRSFLEVQHNATLELFYRARLSNSMIINGTLASIDNMGITIAGGGDNVSLLPGSELVAGDSANDLSADGIFFDSGTSYDVASRLAAADKKSDRPNFGVVNGTSVNFSGTVDANGAGQETFFTIQNGGAWKFTDQAQFFTIDEDDRSRPVHFQVLDETPGVVEFAEGFRANPTATLDPSSAAPFLDSYRVGGNVKIVTHHQGNLPDYMVFNAQTRPMWQVASNPHVTAAEILIFGSLVAHTEADLQLTNNILLHNELEKTGAATLTVAGAAHFQGEPGSPAGLGSAIQVRDGVLSFESTPSAGLRNTVGSVNVGEQGQLRIASELLAADDAANSTIAGNLTVAEHGTFVSHNDIVVAGRVQVKDDGSLYVKNSLTLQNEGVFSVIGENGAEGTALIGIGEQPRPGEIAIGLEGVLQGTGLLSGNVHNRAGGTINIGQSPGLIYVNGSITHDANARLRVELDGTEPVAEFDVLHATGSITLEVNSLVEVTRNFRPQYGDEFDVFRASHLVDHGARFEANGRKFNFQTRIVDAPGGGQVLRIVAVPESGSIVLILCGVAELLVLRFEPMSLRLRR